MKYIPENNLEIQENGPMLETYITDPMSTPNPANWITEIYIAVK
jgi:effector-binding domain-containing protein